MTPKQLDTQTEYARLADAELNRLKEDMKKLEDKSLIRDLQILATLAFLGFGVVFLILLGKS